MISNDKVSGTWIVRPVLEKCRFWTHTHTHIHTHTAACFSTKTPMQFKEETKVFSEVVLEQLNIDM